MKKPSKETVIVIICTILSISAVIANLNEVIN